jgi:hypothetical protein
MIVRNNFLKIKLHYSMDFFHYGRITGKSYKYLHIENICDGEKDRRGENI